MSVALLPMAPGTDVVLLVTVSSSFVKSSSHSRFLFLPHAIFVFHLKNLLCAVT